MSSFRSKYISPNNAVDLTLTWSSLTYPLISTGNSYLPTPAPCKRRPRHCGSNCDGGKLNAGQFVAAAVPPRTNVW